MDGYEGEAEGYGDNLRDFLKGLADNDLGDNGKDLSLDVGKLVLEGLEHVADPALGHGAEDDEGLSGEEVLGLDPLYKQGTHYFLAGLMY